MEWISVKDRRPEPSEDVIVHYERGRIAIGVMYYDGEFCFEGLYGAVTHWMPIPAPPEKEGSPCA